MPAERFDFPTARPTARRAARSARGPVRAVALFAHCFTCGKDIRAARRIAEGLKLHGIAVLRFDFTGLGASEGEFANTTFSSNVDDLVAAADHLRQTSPAPAILIGHSLGGAAVLAAAHRIAEARAVVTIGAPFDPAHVAGLFGDQRRRDRRATARSKCRSPAGRSASAARCSTTSPAESGRAHRRPAQGAAGVPLADRRDRRHRQCEPYLPGGEASQELHLARRRRSSLSRRATPPMWRDVIAAWAERYLDMAAEARRPTPTTPRLAPSIVRETRRGKFQQEIIVGAHRLLADEPVKAGGARQRPGPYDLLLAALGACTSMTLRLYADRKQLPLERTQVRLSHGRIHATDCAECETKEGMIDHIERVITLEGDLDAEQRARLMEIADKCPVHRTLKSEVDIRTAEEPPDVNRCARSHALRPAAITSGIAASLPGAMMWTPATPGMVGKLLDQLDADARRLRAAGSAAFSIRSINASGMMVPNRWLFIHAADLAERSGLTPMSMASCLVMPACFERADIAAHDRRHPCRTGSARIARRI